MATDSVMGLFADPQQIQQAQQQAALQRGIQLAELDPFQRASAQLYQGGYMAGGAIGGALGGQDPQLQMATQARQIMQQVNQNDPKSLMQAAQAFNTAGDVQRARALATAAQELELKQSQVIRNLRERPVGMSELGKLQGERADLVKEFGENDPRVKQYDDKIKKLSTGKTLEETMGAGLGAIASAMAGAQAKKAAEAGGTEVGKKIADIEGSQTALSAIKGAKDIFNKGIYAGKYGPTMEGLAGYTGGTVGSTERLANTETFRSYLGDVVIPGLKDFGGSDTVEELKYLQGVYAGDTTAQPKALKNMLERAETKITSKIGRIQAQQKAIETGASLPTGPTPSATPKATRRFNMQTGAFETITQ